MIKDDILKNLCYTELVYGRINKKLGKSFSKRQIEDLMERIIREAREEDVVRIGKNFYITTKDDIKITINSNTFRIITVDRIIDK